MAVLLNPPASRLGVENSILWGRGRAHHVREFPGPLSLKSVVRGVAQWQTSKARFTLDANSCLVLNHHQPYSITVDSPQPVETFCVFFARGFVEDAWQSLTCADAMLLDHPQGEPAAPLGFYERIWPRDRNTAEILDRMRSEAAGGNLDGADAQMYPLALALCGLRREAASEIARVPAMRAATRQELHQRLHRAKRMIEEAFDRPLTLAQIASEACLSPFHFHRAFTAAFRETPHSYRTRKRLERAARLLHETDRPIVEVCLEAGFESPASFAALFRKRFDRTPSEFRKIRKIR